MTAEKFCPNTKPPAIRITPTIPISVVVILLKSFLLLTIDSPLLELGCGLVSPKPACGGLGIPPANCYKSSLPEVPPNPSRFCQGTLRICALLASASIVSTWLRSHARGAPHPQSPP